MSNRCIVWADRIAKELEENRGQLDELFGYGVEDWGGEPYFCDVEYRADRFGFFTGVKIKIWENRFPDVYIDTNIPCVTAYWEGDVSAYPLDEYIQAEINGIFRTLYYDLVDIIGARD